MKKLNWIDMLVYRLFYWRWNKIFANRPDILDYFIGRFRLYDKFYRDFREGNSVLPNEQQFYRNVIK